jgi:hypothetical protein
MNKIFNILPKPANLHIHFSSIVSYKIIINDIKEYFMNSIFIDEHNSISFYKYNDKCRKITKNDIQNFKIHKSKSFNDIGYYGNMFYGIIKDIYYFENFYMKHIINAMKENNIYYMDIRLKLGSCIDKNGKSIPIIEELEILYKYIDKFNIIIQSNKGNKNMYYYFDNILSKIQNTKYMNLIKGIDLAGIEEYSLTLKDHYKNLIRLKDKYNVNFYFHAGEVIENKNSLINLIYAIKLKSKRIGHGIISLHNKKIMDKIKKYKVFLEICPISNKLLCEYKLDIRNIIDNINNIVICSDDDNKFNSSLSKDFYYLYKKGLSTKYIYILLLNSSKFVNNFDKKKFNNEFKIFEDMLLNYKK